MTILIQRPTTLRLHAHQMRHRTYACTDQRAPNQRVAARLEEYAALLRAESRQLVARGPHVPHDVRAARAEAHGGPAFSQKQQLGRRAGKQQLLGPPHDSAQLHPQLRQLLQTSLTWHGLGASLGEGFKLSLRMFALAHVAWRPSLWPAAAGRPACCGTAASDSASLQP
jgi:hypothetical protein